MPLTVLGQQVTGTTRTFGGINNKALTSNVATLTTSAVHGLAVGDIVSVNGVDSTFDGTYVVATVPTTTSFTYARTVANVTSAAVSPVGVFIRTHTLGGVAASNKACVNGLATITTSTTHSYAVGDWVYISVGDTSLDGLIKVLTVPSTSSITFLKPGVTVASTAISGGATGKASSAWVELYAPIASQQAAVSTLTVANRNLVSVQFRVSVATSTSPTIAETTVFDGSVNATDTVTLTIGMTLPALRKIMVQANAPEVVFTAFGSWEAV